MGLEGPKTLLCAKAPLRPRRKGPEYPREVRRQKVKRRSIGRAEFLAEGAGFEPRIWLLEHSNNFRKLRTERVDNRVSAAVSIQERRPADDLCAAQRFKNNPPPPGTEHLARKIHQRENFAATVA
jgi:hypothetical protein